MAKWRFVVNLSGLFCDDMEEDELTKDQMLAFATGLEEALTVSGVRLDKVIKEVIEGMKSCSNIYEFNAKWINRMYDWADLNKVWIKR